MNLTYVFSILLICLSFNITAHAQHRTDCADFAWNDHNPNGKMAVTLRGFNGKESKRIVHGFNNVKNSMPYSGRLEFDLRQIEFAGNVVVKLRANEHEEWTNYYGMQGNKLYDQVYPWEYSDFNKNRWKAGAEIKILIDDRDYGFGFTRDDYGGRVVLSLNLNNFNVPNPEKIKSVKIESQDEACNIEDDKGIRHWFDKRSIDPSSYIRTRVIIK